MPPSLCARALARVLQAIAVAALVATLAPSGTPAHADSVADACAPEGSAPCNLSKLPSGGPAPKREPPDIRPREVVSVPPVAQNARLGLNFSNYPDNNPGSYTSAKIAGASHDRVTFSMAASITGTGWVDYDRLIAAATRQNIEVLGTLVEPSAPACDTGIRYGIWCVPRGLQLPWNNAGNLWSNWVFQTVTRFKSKVHAWEVWNEPNIDFWSGSNAQYALLLKRSYQAIKAADPTATVVFGGIFRGVNIDRTLGIWNALVTDREAKANNYFFDVMGYHLYDGGHCSTFDEIGFMKASMPAALQSKAWWITESGVRVRDLATDGFANPAQQSSWVIANYAYALFKDIKRYYLWRATDAGDVDQPWGLLTDAGAPRPAFAAYQVAAQRLPTTFNWAERHFDESNPGRTAQRITFFGTPLGRVSVFWNTGHATQTLTTPAAVMTGTYYFQDGSSASAPASNGARVLQLPPAPNFSGRTDGDCLVSSPPVILIERDTTAPMATLNGLATALSTTGVSLSWSATDATGAGDDGVAGVRSFDGQYRIGSGAWRPLFESRTSSATRFIGARGLTYSFRVRAVDGAGNIQDWANARVVTTRIRWNATRNR
ncbi:MAG: hypothetical protein ABIQ99_15285 [Thermoflexales bacterium]